MSAVKLTGWRFAAFVGALVGAVGMTLYPIAIAPMIDSSPYKESQKHTRAGVKQEDIQPGGMKVWTNPFTRKTNEKTE